MPRPVVPPRLTRGELVAGCVPVGALLHASVWGCSPGRCPRWLPHGGGLELRTDRRSRQRVRGAPARASHPGADVPVRGDQLPGEQPHTLPGRVLRRSAARVEASPARHAARHRGPGGSRGTRLRGQGRLSARAPCLRRSHRGACIGLSFPSAHAGASMALYGALAFLLARDLKSTRARRLLPCSRVAHWRDRLWPPVPGRALPLGCPGWIQRGPRVDHSLRSLDRARPDSRRRRRPG
jgi:hypothetical protein